MKEAKRTAAFLLLSVLVSVVANGVLAQDWPQWRGPNRDATATGFNAPESWPKELTEKWKVTVGDGVATPALVGDRLYVFAREAGSEVLRCLDAETGKELWQDKHAAAGVSGAAAGFSGPRSSPTVAEGKVVTIGVQGTLSCLDADSGKLLWRKDDYRGSVPRFSTSSSPIVVDGLCIAQLGGDRSGAIIAYDLSTGAEKWKWEGDSPAYGSPVLMTINGTEAILAPTEQQMVAVSAADGELLWQIPYTQGRYNAATPIVAGQTIIYAGPTRGMTAEKLVMKNGQLAAEELWSNPDNSLRFNTPVLRGDLLFGLSSLNSVFCVDAGTGETLWTAPLSADPGGEGAQAAGGGGSRGRRGGGGSAGYGSVVNAGSVLLALTPEGTLVFFEPSREEFKQLARYKVASGQTYAYPVAAGNNLYIKDGDSVTLWTIE